MKVIDIILKSDNKWLCLLFANSKSDVSDDIEGLPSDVELASGSLVYTGDFEIGVYKEDGNWGWK